MPESPNIPPFRKPVSEFKTPDQTIIFVTELVNRDDPAYTANAPVKRGTLYKDIVGGDERLSTTHPLLYFCREVKFQQSDQYVIWEWSGDEQAHSSYNADITYELEAAGFPVFTRVYTIRRDEYEQAPTIAIGSTLDALIGVTIVDGGQDYTYATGEIVDKDATVEFVVSDGVIISGVVTNEGTGVVAGDLIIVTGDGLGASVIPMVQPTSAVLTSQKKEELPDDNPWANEFVKVTRVYETLPGPTIHSTQLHVDGVVVDVATTKKVASTIVSGETLVGTTWTITTKTQDDNAYTGKEIVITRQVPGNPIPYSKLDDDGKKVTGVRTLKDTSTITTAETLVSTTWTHTYKEFLTTRLTIGEEASDLVSWEVVESRDIPGNPMPSSRLDEDGIKVNVVKTMESAATIAAITSRETLVTGTWTKITSEYISDLVSWKIVETRAIPGNNIVEDTIDDRDGAVQVAVRSMESIATITAITPKEFIDSGLYVKVESKPISELVAWKIVTTRKVPGNPVVESVIDDRDGKTQTVTRTIIDSSTFPPSPAPPDEYIATGVYTKVEFKPITDIIGWLEKTERPVPGNAVVEENVDERDGDIRTVTRTLVDASTITPIESITGGNTYHTVEAKPVTDILAWKVVTDRPLPGSVLDEETVDDRDGAIQSVTRRLFDASTIVPSESIVGGVTYRKVEAKPITDILAWRVVTDRPVPGNNVVKTTIDADGDIVTETRTIVIGPPTLVTTITTAGGVYTKTFGEPINDLISWKVVQVKATQNTLPSYEVEIPDLIPSIFTGLLPITTTEVMVIGIASAPTLATGDLMRRQAQVNYNTYRLTIRGRAGLSLPQSIVVSRQTSEEYGGEILKTTGYLNSSEPSVESGLGIVSSVVKNLGNGTFFRQTETWDTATSWPILTEYDQDPETQALITTTYQVIDATTVSAPSIVNGVITRYKKIDQWRSMEIIETYSLPDSYEEQRFMAHTFPSLWDFTVYNYSTACGPTGPIRQGFASMVQARLAISFTTSKDTIVGLVIQPNTIRLVHDVINAVLNDAGTLTYIGTCSGPITFPASSPDFTTYTTTIQGTEQLISGESVLWRAGLYKNSRLYVTML